MLISRHSAQQGFALPIAIGLGITIMLISLSIIVRSHSDNETALAQRSNVRGLNAAEVGIERFQSLINRYRGIAKYPAFGTAPSWQSPTGISTLSSNCSSGNATDISNAATTDWQAIDPTDSNKGQYRLVNYTYDASTKQGALIVEGRNNLNPSTTRLEIKIPVVLAASPVPGLWVKESLDTGTVQANLWGACSGTFKASLPASGYTMTRTGLAMPDPPQKPATAITTLSSVSGLTLPQALDVSSKANFNPATEAYQYSVSSISESFSISPGKKVHLWVDGNIDLQGGPKAILHQCGTTSPCSPFDARIYGMATSGTLTLRKDTSICDVLIWAPTYSSTILNEGVSAVGCGSGASNNSIYWVKSWTGGGQGGHIALNQTTANWSQSPIQPLPKIAPIKSWQREQSN
jgi:hypothetical protein